MIKRVALFLILLLLSDVTLAQAAWQSQDLSVSYLSMIFGTVGNTLQGVGSGGQMLGQLFMKFNQGVVVVAMIVLAYNGMLTAVRMAQEGQVITMNRNLAIASLRVALGLGVLLPFPSTGYNTLQDVMMKIIIQGVALANNTWDAGLDYIKDGNSLFTPPDANNTKQGAGMFAADYRKAMVYNKDNYKADGQLVVGKNPTAVETKILVNATCSLNAEVTSADFKIFLPQLITNSSGKVIKVGFPNGSSKTGCGEIDLSNTSTKIDASALYLNLTGILQPAAQYLFCSKTNEKIYGDAGQKKFQDMCGGYKLTDDSLLQENVSASMVSGFLSYSSALGPLMVQSASSDDSRKFISDASKMGWVMAGSFYWNLISATKSAAADASYASHIQGSVTLADDFSGSSKKSYYSPGFIENLSKSAASVEGKLNSYISAQTAGSKGTGSSSAWSSGVSSAISVIPLIGQIMGLINNYNRMKDIIDPSKSTSSTNPVVTLNLLGNTCINAAGDLFFGTLIASCLLMLALIFCNAQVNVAKTLSVAIGWLSPIVTILTGAFLGAGFFMAYYVPIFPFVVFTFGVLAWLVAVIEAMVAMPLVALGVTHPEGHDLLGKAEQAMMLTLGVFLRPVLMILGLFAGMLLSLIAYRILIFTFGNLMNNLFHDFSSGAASSGGLMSGIGNYLNAAQAQGAAPFGAIMRALFGFPVMLIVFVSLVYVITEQCYSLIATLPDYILRWIGGPQSSSGVNAMQMASQVGGMAQSASSKIGSAASESLSSGSKATQAFAAKWEPKSTETTDGEHNEAPDEKDDDDPNSGGEGGTGGGTDSGEDDPNSGDEGGTGGGGDGGSGSGGEGGSGKGGSGEGGTGEGGTSGRSRSNAFSTSGADSDASSTVGGFGGGSRFTPALETIEEENEDEGDDDRS